MKRIKNEVMRDPFSDDEPFRAGFGIAKDSDGKMLFEVSECDGKVLRDAQGNAVPKQIVGDLSVAVAIRDFMLTAISPKDCSLDDSHKVHTIMDALRPFKLLDAAFVSKQPDVIVLENAEYEWLLKAFREKGPARYGVRVETYVKAIENLDLVEKPKQDPAHEEPQNGSRPRLEKSRR